MWLLEESVSGLDIDLVFQVYELLDCYKHVYGTDVDKDYGLVAKAIAIKLRRSKVLRLTNRFVTLEMQMYAAAIERNAFTTIYDRLLHDLGDLDKYQKCCCELLLFNSLDWSTETLAKYSDQLRMGKMPLELSEGNRKLLKKYKIQLNG